ncbi:MAG TPA: galactokinase [Planctomycetota bacterium]|nr:galactokinase [Planctomycetota bacterium]
MEDGSPERSLLARLRASFEGRYGSPLGARAAFAPGRVNLLGAHLDYNGGAVLPVALDRGTGVVARLRSDRRLRFASLDAEPQVEVSIEDLRPEGDHAWANYPKGVVHVLREAWGDLPGADFLFGGNLPIGAGLSSSASILLATGFVYARLLGRAAERRPLVDLVWRAEREFVGVQCGIMDPFVSAFGRRGRVLHLDCGSLEFEQLPFDDGAPAVVVADTGARRALASSGFNTRVAECRSALAKLRRRRPDLPSLAALDGSWREEVADDLTEAEARRVRHVFEETGRVRRGAEAIRAGDFAGLGSLLDASHASSRDLYEVSSPELDALAQALRDAGALGARLSGGGFAGCVVALVPRERLGDVEAALAAAASRSGGRAPRVHSFRPAEGVREVGLG